MPNQIITLPFERHVAPTCKQLVTLHVEYQTSLVPIGGSDFYGEQHVAVEITDCKILKVNGATLFADATGRAAIRMHRMVSEFFLWEEHSNEIACRIVEQHVRSQQQ